MAHFKKEARIVRESKKAQSAFFDTAGCQLPAAR